MNMEWRSDYAIHVSKNNDDTSSSSSASSSSPALDVKREAPATGDYGIYNHFVADAAKDGQENVVRVVPRFLFGLPYKTMESMYGNDVDNFPIIGIFTDSPRFDRILIQAYMNIVTLSVIFLLYANNPPGQSVQQEESRGQG